MTHSKLTHFLRESFPQKADRWKKRFSITNMEIEDAFFDTEDYEKPDQTIGSGAFGTVYIVKNKNDHKQYAAKVINTDADFNGREQMQFLRESLILHKLDHPSIVKFIGINLKSIIDKSKTLQPTIITEYIPNGSLKENLEKERNSLADDNWSPAKKYIILLGIVDAMRYLHKHGIVHRDLKPDNILLDENFYPHVCDFGLSRCFNKSLTNSMQMTMTGQLGTPLYMAPEILSGGDKFGSAVDVYAFAIIAYEMATGEVPYNDIIKDKIYMFPQKVISGKRPEWTPNVPPKMRELIEKCWSKNPAERPSFDEIYEKLSNDFTYTEEKVDEDEVRDYISMLEESSSMRKSVTPEIMIESLKSENEFLKKECSIYEKTKNDFTVGLNRILGPQTDIKGAVKCLDQSSEEGNCYSSYVLALLYDKGELVKSDIEKSILYYKRSGQQGNPRAYNTIGLLYDLGKRVRQNYEKAKEYYMLAANFGISSAMNNLGTLYRDGTGVEQDYMKAIEYFQDAVNLGNLNAMNNLGLLYEKGTGVKQNNEKAIEYYQKAANLGNQFAIEKLKNLKKK